MIITKENLIDLCNGKLSVSKLDLFYPLLSKYMEEYEINTKNREIDFISNLLVESGRFVYTKELASGKAYEGRKDLGNTSKGNGVKYKGRGLIQITGKFNYEKLSKDFNVDLISKPELLETPDLAVRSACWFWDSKNLNSLADSDQFEKICICINGGHNGYTERKWYHDELNKLIV